MLNPNDIMLFTREEAVQLSGQVLTDEQWKLIKREIVTNDTMWEVIDECIQNSINEVINNG
jgi:hypothetical protein